MGVPAYFSCIIREYNATILRRGSLQQPVANLYIDGNGIIYDAIHRLNIDATTEDSYGTIIHAVCDQLDAYIRRVNPTRRVFIALDGVAPVAKLEQQRQRRYKSLYASHVSRSLYRETAQITQPEAWNTAAITPGTAFMNQLNTALREKFTNPGIYGVAEMLLSLSDKYGEGEHKIYEYIRTFPHYHAASLGATVVYGLDADLIMLSLHHMKYAPDIYLLREAPHFIGTLTSELEPNELYYLDISQLADGIVAKMGDATESTRDAHALISDYIFLCFFLGNDFLPHFPAVNIRTGGLDKLLDTYRTVGKRLTNIHDDNGGVIVWKNVRDFVSALAANEHAWFIEEHRRRGAKERRLRENETSDGDTPIDRELAIFNQIPLYERQMERFIAPQKGGWEERYYSALFQSEHDNTTATTTAINENEKRQIALNYLQGLEWTFRYYSAGCVYWQWHYNTAYPPLLVDLLPHIPFHKHTFFDMRTRASDPGPVSELVQLCYVLPRQSLTLLPPRLYHMLLERHSNWYSTQPNSFLWAYCTYFWECHVNLPKLSIQAITQLVHDFNVPIPPLATRPTRLPTKKNEIRKNNPS